MYIDVVLSHVIGSIMTKLTTWVECKPCHIADVVHCHDPYERGLLAIPRPSQLMDLSNGGFLLW
jgi:hypothetical protein